MVANEGGQASQSLYKLYALSWAFPSWVAEGGSSPLTNSTAMYTTKWLTAARDVHGLHIDYIGIHPRSQRSPQQSKPHYSDHRSWYLVQPSTSPLSIPLCNCRLTSVLTVVFCSPD